MPVNLRDEEAAFPVLEAVLVAILILSTVLFFTSLQRPTTATDEGGIDLNRLAADTLAILRTKTFATCQGTLGLEQWVGATLNGTECVADDVEAFIQEVLPPGSQFLVRLDNGIEPLVLVPYGSDEAPRAARAAGTYVTPTWSAHARKLGAQAVFPGQELSATANGNATALATSPSILCIQGPSGSSIGPGGATWLSHWQPSPATTPARVPSDLPFGGWAGYTAANCSGTPTRVFVGLPDGTKTDHPVFGLQLVVWFGA